MRSRQRRIVEAEPTALNATIRCASITAVWRFRSQAITDLPGTPRDLSAAQSERAGQTQGREKADSQNGDSGGVHFLCGCRKEDRLWTVQEMWSEDCKGH